MHSRTAFAIVGGTVAVAAGLAVNLWRHSPHVYDCVLLVPVGVVLGVFFGERTGRIPSRDEADRPPSIRP